jgi:hypothetical protein
VKIMLSDNIAIDATVDLYVVDGAYVLQASPRRQSFGYAAGTRPHACGHGPPWGPYSKAIRGAIDLTIDMV